ncbi:MAG: NAD(P)H-binding protein [Candidatus Nanoarchaeia archaeon]|nr:NAD(P)H-binding protein [Candidatus Nanoarchaeia archaeon]
MKILVTGATGFIGKNLVPKIAEKHKVVCFVRKTSNTHELEKSNVVFKVGDLLDRSSLTDATESMDIAIHLATSHKQGNKQDLVAAENLIEACKENKVKKIIFLSSMAAKRKSLDDYGRIKLEIERMMRNSGLNYTILRPSVIYSNNNLSLIGRSLKFPLIIPVIGNGNYKLNPVYIDDVTEAILRSIKSKKADRKSYDVAGGESISFNEIIKICKNEFKINKPVIHMPVSICLLIFKIFPIVSPEAVKGINEDTNADTKNLEKDLKLNTMSFRQGIKNVSL